MSAYIVTPTHIDVIVSYFVRSAHDDCLWVKIDGQYQYMTREVAGRVGELLYTQNVRSVDHRYQEENGGQYGYKYYPSYQLYKISEIAMALDGLEYQSCETDDYHQTEAWEIICSMRKKLLQDLRSREDGDEHSWHIDTVRKGFQFAYQD